MLGLRLVVTLLFGLAFVPGAAAETRVALVVGNAAYRNLVRLKNPANDAAAVAEALRKLDFSVHLATDVDKIGMEEAVKNFLRSLPGAEVALFYYSGHAVEAGEQNHLLPVDSKFTSAAEMVLQSFPLRDISRRMAASRGPRIRLLFLDACRDNPFPEGRAGTGPEAVLTRTIAQSPAERGSLIGFATGPGTVALDGEGRLSPYTTAFVKRIGEPKAEIRRLMAQIRDDVLAATRNRQTPWDSSSLDGEFFFIAPRPPPIFPRLASLSLKGREEGALPLPLDPPRQPEGGRVTVTIDRTPAFGTLLSRRSGRPATKQMNPDEFAALSYQVSGPGIASDGFSFTVEDAWGNAETGAVEIAIRDDDTAAPQALASAPPSAFGRLETRALSLLGMPPNLALPGRAFESLAQSPAWLQLTTAPETGQLFVGSRPLSEGRSLRASELARLTFVPAMGTAGRDTDAVLTAEAPAAGEVRVRIRSDLHPCDRLAGHRFDLQGVAEGVLPYDLDPRAAGEACEAAVRDHPEIGRFQHQLGRALLAHGRNREAYEAFRTAAGLGHVRARTVLGTFAMLGLYVPRDYDFARSEFEFAAARGDVFAIHALGVMHRDGFGTPPDAYRAREQFEASARVGHTNSMNALGELYSLGAGGPKDERLARLYWEASAARRDIFGLNNLGFVFMNGIAGPKDPKRALDYFRAAAERGHPEAPSNVGRMLANGLGAARNQAEAVRWYRMGSDRGDAWAALNLGEAYRVGAGLKTDAAESARLLARAAALPQLEAARIGRTMLAKASEAAKREALRRLVGTLDASAGQLSPGALLSRAGALATGKGATPEGSSLDDVLIALAKAEWLSSGSRIDTL